MSDKLHYLADISDVQSFEVRIEFTDPLEPSLISEYGLPLVSMETEIIANTLSPEAARLREQYGRIPYGAPLYLWELQNAEGTKLLYIGKTVLQRVQKRFEGHASVVKLLARYVNEPSAFVYFKLCSRLDIKYEKDGIPRLNAIEHFPLDQAQKLIDDIEAFLIYRCKPTYNKQYKTKEKRYWKPLSIVHSRNISFS